MKLLSAKGRRNSTHDGQDSSYFLGWQEYERNPYHEARNPNGIIQMGVAENQLCLDLLESWLAQNPDAIAFGESSIFRQVAFSQDYHGLPSFKNAMVEFMTEIRGNKVTFDSNKLVLTAGATLANETLMFCLADLGDAFLVPTPYYPGFETDLKCRTEVEIVPIQCYSSNGFRITESALEEAYEEAQKRNLKVKGVLVTNPSNPLGTTLTRQELNLLLNFIDEKRIHLISHESYSGTVFDSPAFVSAMEVLTEMKSTTDAWDRVHIVYSLSKDLGLPGFRVGAIYSNDEMVVSAATEMSSRFGSFSSQTQYLLSAMLSDKTFSEKYVTENQERLEKRHGMFVKGLEESGIGCLDSNAGLFCWVDMRHLLSSNTFEAEIELWKKIVYDVGLNISPGSSCHCTEPGWFRACFANMSEATLHVAMQRIKAFVDSETAEDDQTVESPQDNWNNNNYSKWVFRLSFNDRETEVAER